MNVGMFAGRLGKDAELRSVNGREGATPVANFSIAVDVGWGQNKETLWVECALWGKRAESLSRFLVKGKQVTVSGDLGLRQWEGKEGKAGASLTLNVQRLTLQGGNEAAPSRTNEAPVRPPQGEIDDDIPF